MTDPHLLFNCEYATTNLESSVMSEFVSANFMEALPVIDLKDATVRDMLLILMRSLAEDEDRVEVICVPCMEGVAFHVRSSANDVGRLIGNRGRTARAVRAILKAIAAKNGRRYTMIIAQ